MRSVDDHLAACLAGVSPLTAREVLLLDGLGCLLAEDVVSPIDMPRFDNSAMDGYAVRAAELTGASQDAPVALPVDGDIPAGHAEPVRLEPGSSLRIMTGAPLPAGADAVVPVEWTDGGTARVLFRQVPVVDAYVRHSGEDVRAGETVLRAGTRLSARHIALLAAVGRDRLLVHPRPLVLVMPSGSELVPPGKPLGPGQIHDSNGYGLIAAVRAVGADAEHGGVIDDNPAAVTAALERAAGRADLIITTGGVSAGAYDTIKEVLRELGTVRFDRVAMQPGMPQGFGVVGPDRTPIFTLPGNPVSALVSFEVFVRPVLRRMAGETSLTSVTETTRGAIAAVGWSSPDGRRQFVRARLEPVDGDPADTGRPDADPVDADLVDVDLADADRMDVDPVSIGGMLVRPVGGQGSHLVADLAEATCLVIVPENVTQVNAGDQVRYLPLDGGPR